MNSIFKHLRIPAIHFFSLFLMVLMARAQAPATVNVVYNLTDFISTPQAVQRLVLTPIVPVAGVGVLGSNIWFPQPISRITGLAGTVTISNVPVGYPFLVQLQDQSRPPNILGTFTNYFPTNLTGTVNATNGLGLGSAPVFGWVFAPGYTAVVPGTNISFATNNGTLQINSTGGGGGGSSVYVTNLAGSSNSLTAVTNGSTVTIVATNNTNIVTPAQLVAATNTIAASSLTGSVPSNTLNGVNGYGLTGLNGASITGTITANVSGNAQLLTNVQGPNIVGALTNSVAYATNAGTATNVTGILSNSITGNAATATTATTAGTASSVAASGLTGQVSQANATNFQVTAGINTNGPITNKYAGWTNVVGPAGSTNYYGGTTNAWTTIGIETVTTATSTNIYNENTGSWTNTASGVVESSMSSTGNATFNGTITATNITSAANNISVGDGNIGRFFIIESPEDLGLTNLLQGTGIDLDGSGNINMNSSADGNINLNPANGSAAQVNEGATGSFYVWMASNQSPTWPEAMDVQPTSFSITNWNDRAVFTGDSNNFNCRVNGQAEVYCNGVLENFTNVTGQSTYTAIMSDRRILCNPTSSSCQIILPGLGDFGDVIVGGGSTNSTSWTGQNAGVDGGNFMMTKYATLEYVIVNLASNGATANTLSVALADHTAFTNLGTTNLVIPADFAVRLTTLNTNGGTNIVAEFYPLTLAPAYSASSLTGAAPLASNLASNATVTNLTLTGATTNNGTAVGSVSMTYTNTQNMTNTGNNIYASSVPASGITGQINNANATNFAVLNAATNYFTNGSIAVIISTNGNNTFLVQSNGVTMFGFGYSGATRTLYLADSTITKATGVNYTFNGGITCAYPVSFQSVQTGSGKSYQTLGPDSGPKGLQVYSDSGLSKVIGYIDTSSNYNSPGSVIATNGFSSYSIATNTMNSTGFTNTGTTNLQVFNLTGTTITYTNGYAKTSVSLGTLTTGQTITFKPQCGVYGTGMAASYIEGN